MDAARRTVRLDRPLNAGGRDGCPDEKPLPKNNDGEVYMFYKIYHRLDLSAKFGCTTHVFPRLRNTHFALISISPFPIHFHSPENLNLGLSIETRERFPGGHRI